MVAIRAEGGRLAPKAAGWGPRLTPSARHALCHAPDKHPEEVNVVVVCTSTGAAPASGASARAAGSG